MYTRFQERKPIFPAAGLESRLDMLHRNERGEVGCIRHPGGEWGVAWAHLSQVSDPRGAIECWCRNLQYMHHVKYYLPNLAKNEIWTNTYIYISIAKYKKSFCRVRTWEISAPSTRTNGLRIG